MSIHFPGAGDTVDTVTKLRALADDLEAMTVFVPRKELEGAPLISNWRPVLRPRPALHGWTRGHPLLGDREAVTSEVYAIDREAGWVRTLSRFYALGAPASDDQEFK
jgi:hypothetical protein